MKKILLSSLLCTCFLTSPVASWARVNPGKEFLIETSKAFTEIGKTAIPAAVFIKAQYNNQTAMGGASAEDYENPFDFFSDEFFRRFFGGGQRQFGYQSNPQPQISGGSGFLVSENGHILTNHHVIKDANVITVVLNDGREYDGLVLGYDPKTDLAVLKIEETGLPYLNFGDSDELQTGEWVIAIGNPFALEASLTVGVVSAKGRQDLGITNLEDFIQTDAAINPGNSGGPLLNLTGDVIGINTAIVSKSGGYMGIGFAIPSNLAKHIMDQIIDTGVVQRAYLGVMLQPIDKEMAEAFELEKAEGILVAEVMDDSPAYRGGLRQGDVIIEYDGILIKSASKFRNEIALKNPGAKVKLVVLRNGKKTNLVIELGKLTENEVSLAELSSKLGIELENLNPDISRKLGLKPEQEGVVISKVRPGSPAAMAGLKPYFVITGVMLSWSNLKKIPNTAEFNNVLKELQDKKHLVLVVRHQNFQRYYTLKIPN